jgi:diguanylate cyclase (GGDEF)-like protein/PAS domain S-box-containing protein
MFTGGKVLMKLLDEVDEGVYFTDRQRRITFWNKAAARISGFAKKDVLGKRCADNILIHIDGRGRSLCRGQCPLARTLRDGNKRLAEIYLHHRDGHRIPVQVRVFPLHDEKRRVIGAAELFTDSSGKLDLGARMEELAKLAMIDKLTGVANRYFSEKSLQARLEEFKRFHWPLGVIFFDIDDFKSFNDRHSHRTGDQALKTVARTLQLNVRSMDLVGRWGGEEFLVILRNTDNKNLRHIAEKLRLLVEKSLFLVNDVPTRITLSGGATLAVPGDTSATLVERADLLMYKSKKAGKNRIHCS